MVTPEIYAIVKRIVPYDDLERTQIEGALEWIQSGAAIFRTAKPDVPKQHLVSYFIIFDESEAAILLVDHKNARLWLPTGGHVEPGEHPTETVRRECVEELGVEADFWSEQPVFLTSTKTVGLTAGHTDVSLWYVLKGKRTQCYAFDAKEFHEIQWFPVDRIPYGRSDPHMRRFIGKLTALVTERTLQAAGGCQLAPR